MTQNEREAQDKWLETQTMCMILDCPNKPTEVGWGRMGHNAWPVCAEHFKILEEHMP